MEKGSVKIITKKLYICSTCGLQLSSSYNLKIHVDTKCSTEKNHQCAICQSKFLTVHSLKSHIKAIHDERKFTCSHCGKSFGSKGQLTVHERTHNKEKPFVCEICSKAFSHRETLVTHSTIHTNQKPYSCENCQKTFSCVGNLIKHRNVRPDTCGLPIFTNKKICKRAGVKTVKRNVPKIIVDAFKSGYEEVIIAEEIQNEEKIQERSEEYFVVEKIDEEFAKKEMEVLDFMSYSLQDPEYMEVPQENQEMIIEELEEVVDNEHVEYLDDNFEVVAENDMYLEDDEIQEYFTVKLGQFDCKLCPKVYSKKNISVNHLKKEHQIVISSFVYETANRYRKPKKGQDFKCRYCSKRYTSQKIAERHEIVHGPDGKLIHKCPCCPLYLSDLESLNDHQYKFHFQKLVCSICQKKFDHPEKLINHQKYSHSDKKLKIKKYSFVCTTCGRNFNTKVALSDHERSNCGQNPIYKCQNCDKAFQSAGNLKIHQTIHTRELNFSCKFCPKQFRTKGQLTVHNRSHLKIKPFVCKFKGCNAEFSYRESLLTHNTIHTGIKRFECEKCLARFSCISNLLAHRRSRKDCSESKIQKVKNAVNSLKAV